jgi:glycosyltransferase involved in cell wall biosynthesis
VQGGIDLARAIGASYWILGPAEDGYGPELERILSSSPVPVITGSGPGSGSGPGPGPGYPSPGGRRLAMPDAYAACDVVAMPSFWEGFGNPTVESAVHRRPLCIGPYPVALELQAYGFEWFGLGDPSALADWLERPDSGLLERNFEIANKHFSLADLPDRLGALFGAAGWTQW